MSIQVAHNVIAPVALSYPSGAPYPALSSGFFLELASTPSTSVKGD